MCTYRVDDRLLLESVSVGRLCTRTDVTTEMEPYRQIHADLPPLPQTSDTAASVATAYQRSRDYAHFFGCRRRERG